MSAPQNTKRLEEKIRRLEAEAEKGRQAEDKLNKLKSLYDRLKWDAFHKSGLINQFRSVINAPELMLDDNWRIIGYSSQFVRLCPHIVPLAERNGPLREILADGEFERIQKRLSEIGALANLPYQEDGGWKLEYRGPHSNNELSRNWRVHGTCRRKNWEIVERNGGLRLLHHEHHDDELDCYLLSRRQYGGPDHDLKIVYRFRTAQQENCIRDVSLVLSGSSGRDLTLPDLVGYTVCLGSFYNSERRIQRQGANVVSRAEELEPDTDYQARIERQGGRITLGLTNLTRGEEFPVIQFIDNEPVYDVLNHIGFTTFSGYLELYGVEIYTRRSRFKLKDFRLPFREQVGLRDPAGCGKQFVLRLAREASSGINRQLLFFEDITDRLEAEAALRESEDKFRRLFEMESDSIFLIDNETGKILEVNQAATALYGYSRKEFLQMRNVDVSAEPDKTHRATVTRLTNIPTRYHHKKNGAVFPVEISARHYTFQGRDVHVAAIRDITEKIQVRTELEKNREFLREVIDSMPDTILVKDRQGKVILASRKLIGVLEEEDLSPLGKSAREYIPFPELAEDMFRDDLDILHGRKKLIQKEVSFVTKSGSNAWLLVTKLPLVSGHGEIDRMVTVVSDITTRKRLEEENLQAHKMESLGVLAGGIAHDFNNILTSILGNISLARLLGKNREKAEEILIEAEKASLRAKDLTQQLLTFSQGGEPVKRMTSLKELITDSAEFVLRGSNVKPDFDFPSELWAVEADPGQISRVIQNLVINADQAMPDGGKIQIRLRNREIVSTDEIDLKPGQYVEIEIKDEGIGIPAEYIDRIFDPYFTTKVKGSGLGLTVCYSIVQKHNGKISVESRPGKYTVFRVVLPAAAQCDKAEQKKTVRSPLGKWRILLMDDEKAVRETVQAMLKHLGCSTITTADGEEAVAEYRKAAVKGKPYDAVILDLTVPGAMGGKEAMTRLREEFPSIKAIVTSGYSNGPVMSDYRSYGFDGMLSKPFNTDDLFESLQDVLGNSR